VPPSRYLPQVLVGRYLDHLRSVRGLSARSVDVSSPIVRSFVQAQGLPERAAFLSASDVRAYLLDRSKNRSTSVVRLLAAALRSFLRFLFLDGQAAADLPTAVLPVRRWRLAAVPQFLTSEDVERVLAATDRSTARGRRAVAMLLLATTRPTRGGGRRARARRR